MTCARLLLILALAPCLNLGALRLQAQNADAAFEGSIQPFLAKNCQSCHNQRASAGNLDLQTFAANPSSLSDQARWESILHRVEAGEMPPQGMPGPAAAEIQTLVNSIRGRFDVSKVSLDPKPGRVTARRLNRTEYNNTVEKVTKINTLHAEHLAYFLGRLKSTPEGDGNLLDHSMIVYASAIADGSHHTHTDLPAIIAGHGKGALKVGQHIRYAEGTSKTNLWLTLLDRMDVYPETIGDSTGRLDHATEL